MNRVRIGIDTQKNCDRNERNENQQISQLKHKINKITIK